MFTQLLKERDSIAALPVFPASMNGSQVTGAVDASKFNRINFDVLVGTLGSGGSIQAYLCESVNSNGTGLTNISGGAITNIATANCAATLEVSAMSLTKRYVYCGFIVNVIASIFSCTPRGTEGRFPPVNSNDSVSVTQRLAI